MLVGRETERARIDRLLDQARSGASGVLVVRGEAGIGKSALLDRAADGADGMRVLRGVGVESEAELAFGALHLLLYPYFDRLDALPRPQAAALRAAFGLTDSPAPNRFLIGAATLTLLAELAAETPLLCLIDDAQWLDQGSSDALLFAARRFQADPVALLFGVRETAAPFPTPGIDMLRLEGLPRPTAEALLRDHAPGLTAPVRDRVLEEADGNPLALIELARAGQSDPVQQVGPLPVSSRVQETFREQIANFPRMTRLLLLIAAADGAAGVETILQVADTLGASAKDLEPAEQAHLVTLAAGELKFRHPLIRAAAYQNAPHHQRIAVHAALADVLTDADRRAWHRAAATTDPDEDVAAELERTAQRAQHRGGLMAVSAAYDRAGRLSVDPELKARRITKAARAAYNAGRPDRAIRLAAEAESLSAGAAITAEALFVRAQIECERTASGVDAALALDAAALLVDSDPRRAMVMCTESVIAARNACAHDLVGKAARLIPGVAAVAWADFFDGRPERAAAPMRELIAAAQAGPVEVLDRMVAGFSALMLAEDEAAVRVMTSMVSEGRATGALLWIPYSLDLVALGHLLHGDFFEARTSLAEAVPFAEELGMDTQLVALQAISVWLAAVQGDEPGCRALADEVLPRLDVRHPANAALARWGLGVLDLATGHVEAALDTLDSVCATRDLFVRAVPDHVEAAVRASRPGDALRHLPELDRWAEHAGPVASALSSRCHALLSTDDGAEDLFTAALKVHEQHGGPYDHARTRLVYGEWLRRRRRRSDARDQLLAAMDTFERLGARLWAARTAAELDALGERPVARPHDTDLLKRLTPQEVQVVRLAATGLSNKEIGAQLFLSPRTISHHLYKAYPKLGVTKRIELTRLPMT